MSVGGERAAARAEFTLEEVLAATGGELVALGNTTRLTGVTTDSRSLEKGELFVAVQGESHDGHAYLDQAATRGAGAVLVERVPETRPACGVIAVRDSLRALGDLAAFHRRRHGPRVVAITGSNGKTTTKEMLNAILVRAFGSERVLSTPGTKNNLVGLPLTLLRLAGEESAAVVEIGMNGPGEIWRLAQIAQPDVGVVTCVAPAHLAGLGSIRGVAVAKGELYRRLRPSATAVVNADDPLAAPQGEAFPGRKVRFGTAGGTGEVAVGATEIVDHGLDGTEFHLVVDGHDELVRLAIPGRHNVTNALAAAAAAHALGVAPDVVKGALESFTPPGMRMEVVQLGSGVTVLNDAYNANPSSMTAALRTLAASRGRRRLAALGDMRELGPDAARAHHDVGKAAAAAELDGLFLLGAHAPDVRAGAEEAGFPAERIFVAATHAELGQRLRAACRSGDLLLIKGSRGSAMEEVLRHLEGAEARP